MNQSGRREEAMQAGDMIVVARLWSSSHHGRPKGRENIMSSAGTRLVCALALLIGAGLAGGTPAKIGRAHV
jgi:hypothetical protein